MGETTITLLEVPLTLLTAGRWPWVTIKFPANRPHSETMVDYLYELLGKRNVVTTAFADNHHYLFTCFEDAGALKTFLLQKSRKPQTISDE